MWNPTKFKIARIEKGLMQWQAADQFGISRGALNRVENGKKDPSNKLVEAMSTEYSKPISYFLSDEARAGVENDL